MGASTNSLYIEVLLYCFLWGGGRVRKKGLKNYFWAASCPNLLTSRALLFQVGLWASFIFFMFFFLARRWAENPLFVVRVICKTIYFNLGLLSSHPCPPPLLTFSLLPPLFPQFCSHLKGEGGGGKRHHFKEPISCLPSPPPPPPPVFHLLPFPHLESTSS